MAELPGVLQSQPSQEALPATGAVQEADGGGAGAQVPTATGKAEGGGRPGSPASHR